MAHTAIEVTLVARWPGCRSAGVADSASRSRRRRASRSRRGRAAAVNQGSDPRIGAAILRTWATWDPSRDQARRLNQALNSILTTNVGGGPIDQDVFDEAAEKWDEYFRE